MKHWLEKHVKNKMVQQLAPFTHQQTQRKWGTYEIIARGNRWVTKILTVDKGKSISLQKHFWRTEHWLFLEGYALFWKEGDKVAREIKSKNNIWIAKSQLHWVKNISPSSQKLIILETWMGNKLEEDDIERIEDETIIPFS